MFHVRYQELIPLVTDSMFIRIRNQNAETTRAIGFRYKEDGTPNGWKETREISVPHQLWIFEQYYEATGNGMIINESFIDSLFPDTLRSRQIVFGPSKEQPDSVYSEVWGQDSWNPRQKTVNQYDANDLLLRKFDWEWDAATSEWKNKYFTQNYYDGNHRVIQRQNLEWRDTAWLLRQSHFLAYRPGENKPKNEVWFAGSLPMDSTAIWYDSNAFIDSMQNFSWDDHNQAWEPNDKKIFDSPEAKTAENGNLYLPIENSGGGAVTQWIEKERREFVTGNNDYTNEPGEEVLLKLNLTTGNWEEYWRRSVQYSTLSDSSVYAKLSITERNTEGAYDEIFSAEAWLHIAPDSLQSPPVESRMDKFTFSYTCGFYNPYVQNQTVTFPATEATGNYELKIFAEDNRLIFQQMYDNSGSANVNAPLAPGVYFVAVNRGGVPLCTQKLVVP